MSKTEIKVTRLKGENSFGTYIVSVFVADGRIDRVEIGGKPNCTVAETCDWLSKIRTTLVNESITAIKLDMIRFNEYRGETCSMTIGQT
jgi:hypothetical protein